MTVFRAAFSFARFPPEQVDDGQAVLQTGRVRIVGPEPAVDLLPGGSQCAGDLGLGVATGLD